MKKIKTLPKRFHRDKKQEKYPKICPFCGEKKRIAKDWARFPDNKLTQRKPGVFPLFTLEAEREWFDVIICLQCCRIIWHQLDPQGHFERKIPLPTLQELTGWYKIPYTPIIFYDKEGNPVYGTERSKEMYRKEK